jgi:hypothetical protein
LDFGKAFGKPNYASRKLSGLKTVTPKVGCKIYGKNKIFIDPFLNSELFVSLKLWGYFFATKAQKHQVSQKII